MRLPPFLVPKLKLRIKLILIFALVAIIPLLSAMYITTSNLQSQAYQDITVLDKQIAQTAVAEVKTFLLLQFDALETVNNLYPELSDPALQNILLERIIHKNGNFEDLAIVDEEGRETARQNTFKIISKDQQATRSATPEFRAIKDSEYYIGPLFNSNGRPVFIIGKKLTGVDDSFKGGAFAVVDARVMQDITKDISKNVAGLSYIVDDKGKVIAHPDISNVLAQKDFSKYPTVSSLINSSQKNTPEVYINSENQEVLGAGAEIDIGKVGEISNWYVIVEQPATAALAPVNRIAQVAIPISLLVLIISIFLTYIFADKIVSPIEKVHSAIIQFGSGNFSNRVDIETHDEIEGLAKGFNAMAENIKQSINILEHDKSVISAERNKLSMVLSGISDAVIAVDITSKVVIFNLAAEKLTGYKLEEVLYKPINELVQLTLQGQKLDAGAYCPVRFDGFEGVNYQKEGLKLIGKDGKTSNVNLIAGCIKEGLDVNLGCILTLHDTSAEAKLEEMKLDFVTMAAHELRTPLTSIRGYLFILSRDLQGVITDHQTQILTRVNISAQRLVALVENLLNISRIEKKAVTLRKEKVDWIKNTQEVISELMVQVKDKELTLTLLAPKYNLPLISIDKFRINEVLVNLLSNAINYTPKGGKIIVWMEKNENSVITHVQDTGEGIPKDAISHLFTKFFRVSGRLEQGSKGTGLGLYIAKSILNLHNGNIWVESEFGKGSTFSFSLPINDPMADTQKTDTIGLNPTNYV